MPYFKSERDDIIYEVNYWDVAVTCYVLAVSPPSPFGVLNGFIRRIRDDVVIDKVVMLTCKILFCLLG